MKHTEFGWHSPSNVKIYAQSWWPDDQAKLKGIILLIHGLGEHSSRYEHVAEFFTHYGFAVLSCDRSGHGKSGGKLGHIAKYEEVFDDIVKLHSEASRKHSQLPVFLYGHSMGGGIVIDYLLNKKHTGLKGIIATAPLLEPAFKPPSVLLFIGRIMRSIYPRFTQDNQLDVKMISRDELVVQAYTKDPLVHSKITSETAIGMLTSGENSLKNVGKINSPLLLMHGDKDGLTSHKATQQFASKASGDVTLKMWEGFYHELHNEPEKLDVLEYIYQWILQKL
ncbi:MAG: lysophospholipase [Saprospiraceae bacterium]|nr:lysophospholipase [Saprospiraceae bacterium]